MIIYNKELSQYNFKFLVENTYKNIIKNIIFYELENQTKGPVETIYLGLEYLKTIDTKLMSQKTICIDGDTFYTHDILKLYRNIKDNMVLSFITDYKDPVYSYLLIDNDNYIKDIKEKEKFDNDIHIANSGCYGFLSGDILLNYSKKILKTYELEEYYTSYIIKTMLKDKEKFKTTILDTSHIHVLGTPIQLRIFSNNNLHMMKKYRFCFDLDYTLLYSLDSDYKVVNPIKKNIM